MSQFAAVTLTKLFIHNEPQHVRKKATYVIHPPLCWTAKIYERHIGWIELFKQIIITIRNWAWRSHIYFVRTAGFNFSVFCTTALHESLPPTAPQLQRLPNGYPLVSALWSSTAPLGRGLSVSPRVCVHERVYSALLYCTICTVTG